MIGKDHAGDRKAFGQQYFKGIPLHLARNGADNREARLFIIRARREHNSGATPGLLMSGLRIEVEPDQIPGMGDVRSGYHASLPVGLPQSVSRGQFPGVIALSSCAKVSLRFAFRMRTAPGPATRNSNWSPWRNPAASATCLGTRTARLFPHLVN